MLSSFLTILESFETDVAVKSYNESCRYRRVLVSLVPANKL